MLVYLLLESQSRHTPLSGRLLCSANAIHASGQESSQPHCDADVFGEHRSQAFSIVRHAHKLMESTAQSIISQNGVREREEDSRTAEARLLVPVRLYLRTFIQLQH